MDTSKKYLDVISDWKSLQGDYTDILVDVGPAKDPGLTDLQSGEAQALIDLTGLYGQFDQDGVGGAHYLTTSPFATQGLSCNECVFYEGAGACDIVSGNIDPLGLCRFYVIPNDETAEAND